MTTSANTPTIEATLHVDPDGDNFVLRLKQDGKLLAEQRVKRADLEGAGHVFISSNFDGLKWVLVGGVPCHNVKTALDTWPIAAKKALGKPIAFKK